MVFKPVLLSDFNPSRSNEFKVDIYICLTFAYLYFDEFWNYD